MNAPQRALASSLVLVTALAACAGARREEPKSAPAVAVEAAAHPWPTTFQRDCVLAAARVEITGPRGLLEHLAIRQDSQNHAHVETATAEGLRIVESHKPESDSSPIRAQLDALVIVADVELVVLESVGADRLVIEASGDAYFRYVDTGEERRARTLRLEGER